LSINPNVIFPPPVKSQSSMKSSIILTANFSPISSLMVN